MRTYLTKRKYIREMYIVKTTPMPTHALRIKMLDASILSKTAETKTAGVCVCVPVKAAPNVQGTTVTAQRGSVEGKGTAISRMTAGEQAGTLGA